MKKQVKGVIGLLIAFAIVVGTSIFILNHSSFVEEKKDKEVSAEITETLKQWKNQVDNADFVALEIVPSESLGELGYLVSGQEPIDTVWASMDGKAEEIGKLSNQSGKEDSVIVKTTSVDDATYKEYVKKYVDSGLMTEEELAMKLGVTLTEDQSNDTGKVEETETNENNKPESTDEPGTEPEEKTEYKFKNAINQDKLKAALESNGIEADKITVITATPEQLNDAIKANDDTFNSVLKNVGMFYFTLGKSSSKAKSDLYYSYPKDGKKKEKPETIAESFLDNDISWAVAEALFEQVGDLKTIGERKNAAPAAFIMDSEIYNTALDKGTSIQTHQYKLNRTDKKLESCDSLETMHATKGSTNNLYKLYLMTMFRDPVEFYNLFVKQHEDVNGNKQKAITEGSYNLEKNNEAKTAWSIYSFLPCRGESSTDRKDVSENSGNEKYWNYMGITLEQKNSMVQGSTLSWDSAKSYIQELNANIYDSSNNQYKYLSKVFEDKKISSMSASNVLGYQLSYLPKQKAEKTEFKVLNLEPCADYNSQEQLNAIFSGLLPYSEWDSLKFDITQMTTAEFIGNLDSLTTEYDFIYVGDNVGKLYVSSGVDDYGKKMTNYNDNSMDGLIYTHVGDVVRTKVTHSGASFLLNGLNTNAKVSESGFEQIRSGEETYRYSGNDITKIKKEQMEKFLKAGHAIVFADRLYNQAEQKPIDTYIDKDNCNLRKLMELKTYDKSSQSYEKIMINTKSFRGLDTKQANQITNAITKAKPSLEITSKPGDYIETWSGNSLVLKDQVNSGKLTFTFRINDEDFNTDSSIRYTAKLYVDTDADGDYSDPEEYVGKTSSIKPNRSVNLSRPLNQRLRGVICWKLEVSNNKNQDIVLEQKGYTSVHDEDGAKVKIRILQIQSDDNKGVTNWVKDNVNNWNLEKLFYDASTSKFYKYMHALDSKYDITIHTVSMNDYSVIKSWKPSSTHGNGINKTFKLKEINEDYDMLIFGFGDSYSDVNMTSDAINHTQEFINAGKSVLFTHDLTSQINNPRYTYTDQKTAWCETSTGARFNVFFRDVMGMNRFGVYPPSNFKTNLGTWDSSNNQLSSLYGQVKSRIDKQTSDITSRSQKQGYTYSALMQYATMPGNANSGTWGNNGPFSNLKLHTAKSTLDFPSVENGYETTKVSKCNDGQITKYPYSIKDQISVAKTHGQYFQLNMEDKEMVVWYALDDGKKGSGNEAWYSTSPNDVSNNYYIYNKGNITYSGVGHRKVENGSDDEVKLFVNTMIAAYKSGVIGPGGEVPNGVYAETSDTHYIYTDLDSSIADTSSEWNGTIDVKFLVTDDTVKVGDTLYVAIKKETDEKVDPSNADSANKYEYVTDNYAIYDSSNSKKAVERKQMYKLNGDPVKDDYGTSCNKVYRTVCSSFDNTAAERYVYTLKVPKALLKNKNAQSLVLEVFNKDNLKGTINVSIVRRALFPLR